MAKAPKKVKVGDVTVQIKVSGVSLIPGEHMLKLSIEHPAILAAWAVKSVVETSFASQVQWAVRVEWKAPNLLTGDGKRRQYSQWEGFSSYEQAAGVAVELIQDALENAINGYLDANAPPAQGYIPHDTKFHSFYGSLPQGGNRTKPLTFPANEFMNAVDIVLNAYGFETQDSSKGTWKRAWDLLLGITADELPAVPTGANEAMSWMDSIPLKTWMADHADEEVRRDYIQVMQSLRLGSLAGVSQATAPFYAVMAYRHGTWRQAQDLLHEKFGLSGRDTLPWMPGSRFGRVMENSLPDAVRDFPFVGACEIAPDTQALAMVPAAEITNPEWYMPAPVQEYMVTGIVGEWSNDDHGLRLTLSKVRLTWNGARRGVVLRV